MHLHLVPETSTHGNLYRLDEMFLGEAANDCSPTTEGRGVSDLNLLVTDVVGHVTAQRCPHGVSVELSLAHGRPMIDADATELRFAVAGIVGAMMRSLEGGDDETLRVEVRADDHAVEIVIAAREVPPLGYIRALAESIDPARAGDPTLRHCRRLVERQGGTVGLAAENGLFGVAVAFPTVKTHRPDRVLALRAPRRNTGVCLAALAA
jgi:hypothetical protein